MPFKIGDRVEWRGHIEPPYKGVGIVVRVVHQDKDSWWTNEYDVDFGFAVIRLLEPQLGLLKPGESQSAG